MIDRGDELQHAPADDAGGPAPVTRKDCAKRTAFITLRTPLIKVSEPCHGYGAVVKSPHELQIQHVDVLQDHGDAAARKGRGRG